MFIINVDLGPDSYKVYFQNRLEPYLSELLQNYQNRKICLVTDQNVFNLYGKEFFASIKKYTDSAYSWIFPPGEENKNINEVSKLIDYTLANRWSRDDLFIMLGGGIVGDMGAFAAAIILRGIACVQIPTTLLSQVDSGIGGKTGVNHSQGKNLIGAFYQPKAVFMSPHFFQTLPTREIKTGLAEVVKCGMIRSLSFFSELENWFKENDIKDFKVFPESFWEMVVKNCAQIKADVVSQDEKESGLRMILNYGHTFGHAIEKINQYENYTHGEAVAVGMNMAAFLAWKQGICNKEVFERQDSLLKSVGMLYSLKEPIAAAELVKAMAGDKKVKDSKIRLVLPEAIGKVRIVDDLSSLEIESVLNEFLS